MGSLGAAAFVIPCGLILMIVGVVLSAVWKTNCKTRKSSILAVIILVLSVVFSIAFLFVADEAEKAQAYKEANEAMKEEDYYTAIEGFEGLENYKDSKDKVLECKYLQAGAEEKDENFQGAIEIYTSLKDYKDSKDKIIECKYLNAKSYIEDECFEDAIEILNEIKSYKDAEELIGDCNFNILKSDYEWEGDLIALIDGINEKCPDNDKAQKFVNKQIAEDLSDYDNLEYYQDAVNYLKKLSDKWDVKKELKKYENKEKKQEEQKKVEAKFEDLKIEYGFGYEGSAEYAMTDINNDGIEEIIISYGTCDADWKNDFYHLDKSGKVVCAGTLETTASFYGTEDGNGIYAVNGSMGYETRYHIFLKGDKLKMEVVEEREIGIDEDYYSNDKPIEMESDSFYW